jgi:hypothetical protein
MIPALYYMTFQRGPTPQPTRNSRGAALLGLPHLPAAEFCEATRAQNLDLGRGKSDRRGEASSMNIPLPNFLLSPGRNLRLFCNSCHDKTVAITEFDNAKKFLISPELARNARIKWPDDEVEN